MKAIILAAGLGKRLGKYTENLPKCMLSFNGKPLIEWQVETLKKTGITDISIVRGYRAEAINLKDVKYYLNEDYLETNMVDSLFAAEKELDSDILILYSDIIYEQKTLKKIMASKADIGVTADEDYLDYWKARLGDIESDTESFVVNNGKVIGLGEPGCSRDKAKQRYVGMIKLSKKGCEAMKHVYHDNKKQYFNKNIPWLMSKNFKRAFMTDMIQAMIDKGYHVEPILIKRGWLEFDTVEDYENYSKWLKENTLSKFFDIKL